MTLPKQALACVVPCYNVGDRALPVVQGVLPQVGKVCVVDDGCTDGSTDALAQLPVQLLRHGRNLGKGHAILTGLRAALEDPGIAAVLLLDADGQHDPAAIPAFLAAMERGDAGLLIGLRQFDQGHVPWRSRFGNTVTAAVTRWLLRADLPDTQCGFRLLSRDFALQVVQRVQGGRYETEMEMLILAIRSGVGIRSVPIQTIYETGNRSSHFRKLSDSVRIYARLLRAALG